MAFAIPVDTAAGIVKLPPTTLSMTMPAAGIVKLPPMGLLTARMLPPTLGTFRTKLLATAVVTGCGRATKLAAAGVANTCLVRCGETTLIGEAVLMGEIALMAGCGEAVLAVVAMGAANVGNGCGGDTVPLAVVTVDTGGIHVRTSALGLRTGTGPANLTAGVTDGAGDACAAGLAQGLQWGLWAAQSSF